MRLSIILFIFTAILLTGCASKRTSSEEISSAKPRILSDEQTRNLMIGKWYGSQALKDGGIREELAYKAEDGTYQLEFQFSDKDGKKTTQIEVGNWGISGSTYFSIFRGWMKDSKLKPSNPKSHSNYDAYRIIELNDEIFEYQHMNSGNKYKLKRVALDFKL